MINIPTRCGLQDSNGTFCRWGESGKKYYYTPGNRASMERARSKANAQGRAAHAHGYQGAESSDIQALVFDKDKFTRSSAKSWATSHGFTANTIRETENTYRIRQFPPENCKDSGGMTTLDEGVQGYVCITQTSKSSKEMIELLQLELNRIKNDVRLYVENREGD